MAATVLWPAAARQDLLPPVTDNNAEQTSSSTAAGNAKDNEDGLEPPPKTHHHQPTAIVNTCVTVHLVDACGRVVDVRPVPDTLATAAASPSLLMPSGDGVDQPEDDSGKCVAALAGCPSRVQEDLKHIPPGKNENR